MGPWQQAGPEPAALCSCHTAGAALERIPVVISSFTGACAEQAQGEPMALGSADVASIDAWLLAVLEDEELRQQVRQLKKVELANV